jgi:hypothetical protein
MLIAGVGLSYLLSGVSANQWFEMIACIYVIERGIINLI